MPGVCTYLYYARTPSKVPRYHTKKFKPSPEPFNKAVELLKVPPKNIIMVGDWRDRDVVGGKLAGMKTAFAKYGDVFGTENSGADYDLNDISEILDIVSNS